VFLVNWCSSLFSVALSAFFKKLFFSLLSLDSFVCVCVCVCLFFPPFERGPNLLLLSFVWSEDLERELRILLVEVLFFFLFVFFGGFLRVCGRRCKQ